MTDLPALRRTPDGKRVGGEPKNEAEHFMKCDACGGWIDCRRLDQVFAHEVPDIDVATAYADGYAQALEDCERADAAALVRENEVLKARLVIERELRSPQRKE